MTKPPQKGGFGYSHVINSTGLAIIIEKVETVCMGRKMCYNTREVKNVSASSFVLTFFFFPENVEAPMSQDTGVFALYSHALQR